MIDQILSQLCDDPDNAGKVTICVAGIINDNYLSSCFRLCVHNSAQ